MMNNNQLRCSLHNQPFSLYCDRCLQLICHRCTVLGPHNSAIHSICQLPHAYQKRVDQINNRLNNLLNNRDDILSELNFLIMTIDSFNIRKQKINSENQKQETKLQMNLNKSYENIANLVAKAQQQLYQPINLINDLGHEFQTLPDHIETVINYQKIVAQLKQICDKIEILLRQNPSSVLTNQLPKQLTNLRIKLQQIDTLKDIFNRKQQILKQLIIKLEKELKAIQAPVINYEGLLEEINLTLLKYSGKGTICFFCGIIMNQNTINTICTKNQLNEQLKKIQLQRGISGTMLDGYGAVKPENAKFGTHRHYFCDPRSPNQVYRAVFINNFINTIENQQEKQQLSSKYEDNDIFCINKGLQNVTFFNYYLDGLILKIKTLQKIRKKNLKVLLEKQDTEKGNKCDKVALQYILIELIGLSQQETSVIKQILKVDTIQKGIDNQYFNYDRLLKKMEEFYI